MSRTLSAHGRRFIETWEELVLYVYDDKVAPRKIDGKRRYVEWDGGAVRGTLTIGYGHTDAAGAPKIAQDMRITAAQADAILDADLAPVMAQVTRDVKVPLTQGQFDALVSFTFNAGEGSLRKLIVKLNRGDYDDVPGHMLEYTMSKGERMQGLVNRRHGEIALWNTPDAKVAAAPAPEPLSDDEADNFSPKAERKPAPKSMSQSKTGAASITVGAGGVVAAVQAANDAVAPLKDAKQNLDDLGLLDILAAGAHMPAFWIGLAIIGLATFIWFDRRRKLIDDHV